MQRVREIEPRPDLPACPPQFHHQAGDGGRPEDREGGLRFVKIGSAERENIDCGPLAFVDLAPPVPLHQRMYAATIGEGFHD